MQKVKVVPVLNRPPRHEDVLESEGITPCILTSVPDGGEWSGSRLGRSTLGYRDPGTNWIGGWVGPRASLDVVEKRKNPWS